MKASIHIASNRVEVIAYTKIGDHINIRDYLTYPIPEECIINGVILDATPIIEGLRSLKSSKPVYFKDVTLVIDGSFVYTKKITVPGKLHKITYDEVIRDEFADVATDAENLICDYFHLSDNADGSKDILACGVEYIHAQAYLAIFKAADMKLSAVHLGVIAVLRCIRRVSELQKLPYVLNIVDDMMLLSMIFQNGINVFQSRKRIYGDDRITLVNSSLDGLSGIIQFNKSQNFEDITHCFYLGFSESDMDLVAMNTSYPEILFSALDIFKGAKGAEMLPPGAHFIYMNTLIPDTQSDLLANIKMLEKAKERKRPKNRWLPIFACVVIALAAAIATLWILNIRVQTEIDDLNAFFNTPETITYMSEIDALKYNNTHISGLYNAVESHREEIGSQPHVTKELLETIIRTGRGVTVNGIVFSSENGTISVSSSVATETTAANYVEALKKDALVDTVNYTGYSTGSSGEYVFTIDVIATGWR